MIVDFPWEIGQRVKIQITDRDGEVCGLFYEQSGAVKAQVRYADGNNSKTVYCYAAELCEPSHIPGESGYKAETNGLHPSPT